MKSASPNNLTQQIKETPLQQEILLEINRLNENQQKALIDFLKTL